MPTDHLGEPPLPYARLDHTHTINIDTEPVPTPAPAAGSAVLRTLGVAALGLAVIIEVVLIVWLIRISIAGWPG